VTDTSAGVAVWWQRADSSWLGPRLGPQQQ